MNSMLNGLLVIACLCSLHQVNASPVVPPLPEPVSNNAVALVTIDNMQYLLSFMGLGENKDHHAVHNKVWALKLGDEQWQSKSAVPSSLPLKGRLASIAVAIKEDAYLFGGYTVAEDHSEISSPDNFKYQLKTDRFFRLADMPVPVDDAVALVYQQRYIYIISGWHNDGNVNLVQIYDIQTDSWQQGSPFPGRPVFGQAGGIVGNFMLICDGVKIQPLKNKRRTFASETACFSGQIDNKEMTRIDWRLVDHPTGKARYRMAGTGLSGKNRIVFAGGSHNPYNYNGIGYDGNPSQPVSQLWIFDIKTLSWKVQKVKPATMDHRGLIYTGDSLMVIGGMGSNQTVLNEVTQYSTDELE